MSIIDACYLSTGVVSSTLQEQYVLLAYSAAWPFPPGRRVAAGEQLSPRVHEIVFIFLKFIVV